MLAVCLSTELSICPLKGSAGCLPKLERAHFTMRLPLTLLLFSMAAASTDLRPFFEAASAGAQQLAAMLECKDENDACPSWAAAGECTNNAGSMHAEEAGPVGAQPLPLPWLLELPPPKPRP